MKFKKGSKCSINKGTLGEIKGTLSKVPYKDHGEWFVEVTYMMEDMKTDGSEEYYIRSFRARVPKDKVTMT